MLWWYGGGKSLNLCCHCFLDGCGSLCWVLEAWQIDGGSRLEDWLVDGTALVLLHSRTVSLTLGKDKDVVAF